MRSKIAAWLAAAVATLVLLEVGTCALVETGRVVAPRPSDRRHAYWRGDHPEFGVWHAPGLAYEHRTRCYDLEYRTNSVGARDVERPLRSQQPRVVVLGDSYLEGWGVSESERLSNLLEEQTGIEHLNFAMSHFGPYQEYLVYRSLASRFDHDAVLVGVLPANDFVDIDFEEARKHRYYRFHYRPYLVGDPPDLRHVYPREPRWRRWLRHWSYTGSAVITAVEARARERAAVEVAQTGERAWFYDFGDRQARLLEAVLERLAAEAAGKRVTVVLIPTLTDLRSHARFGPDPLSVRLRAAGERSGYRVVDLLPSMAEYTQRWPRYFLRCDYHWSAFGNAIAANLLREALGPEFYGEEDRGEDPPRPGGTEPGGGEGPRPGRTPER